MLRIEVRRDTQPVAVNTHGAGRIGAAGAGVISFGEIPGPMRNAHAFVPVVANRPRYGEAFHASRRSSD